MENEEFSLGETIFCWRYGESFIGHKHMLFLGKDSSGVNKVLVPHPRDGWAIIKLEELPQGYYRSIGLVNILSRKVDDNGIRQMVYLSFDKGDPIELTVNNVNGDWELLKDFQTPSWVGGEDARGTGSEENCGSDVTSHSGEGIN